MALQGDYNYIPHFAWINEGQRRDMKIFLKGLVYCWCKNRKDEWFAARDLLGGDNYFWQDTPMIDLYLHYEEEGYGEDAVNMAGKGAGKLLMEMLDEDKRTYETGKEYTRCYRWTGVEDNDL